MGTVNVPSVDVTDTELFDLNVKSLFSLPVLIDRLSDMEQDQMTDIRASIHGRGSYQLTGQAQVLQVSFLPTDQKMRRLNRLLTFK
jgi:hypothetical protein